MRHKRDVKKLGRNKSHRKALMRNMTISFFQNQKIITTNAKAKQLRRIVERLITLAKRGTLADYRRINQFLNHPQTVKKIIDISKKYVDRNGGYTQIYKIGFRRGDSAEKVMIKLV
ncbi:MAG: 50S ribosomal protein L17 [Candidatus Omnitrophica bacterium]|nr:50S ribosomal protein L17 [Candidatus Omnitrophota bacterium]MCM8807246.1 50S ribosomal protein L17 [Candidatus Omnitrophota bacterium]